MIDVFLGGSCNPTTWRIDKAIPMLKAANVSYYNPQVDEWYPELIGQENKAKNEARHLLFVIDGQTRALASILEATELISAGYNNVWLVIENVATEDFPGKNEAKDLNRARDYLRNLADRNDYPVHPDVSLAVQDIIITIKTSK